MTKLAAKPEAAVLPVVNVLFNGEHYYVGELLDREGDPRGFEVVNKTTGFGAFLDGAVALKMRTSFQDFVVQHNGVVSVDEVEEFISAYDPLLMQRVVYH